MRQRLRCFLHDRRGNIATMAAGGMVMMIGCAAFGVDLGSIYLDRRKAQSVADLAAIGAAGDLARANSAALATITRNNLPADALSSVELGIYRADAALPPDQRFTAGGGASANAVRVSVETKTPLYFGKVLNNKENFTIRTHAVASTTEMASFAIGSRLVSLDGGLLNQLLGNMLGTTLSLSAMDYQALLDAKIDAFKFISALATRADLGAISYSDVLASNLKLVDALGAMLDVQRDGGGLNSATSALSHIVQAASGLATKITLNKLINAGPYDQMTAGTQPKVGVDLALLDLISATAAIANGARQIETGLNLNLPGLASVKLMAGVGERPQGTSWVTVGDKGASVHTAQTRVLLQVKLLPVAGIGGVIELPLYVEVASGTATLNGISCGRPDIATSTVTLGVTPGVIDAWIADVSPALMTNFSTKPNPGPVALVEIPLLLGSVKVSGKAHAMIGNLSPQSQVFTYTDILARNPKTVQTSDFTSSLVAKLLKDLNLKVEVIGIGLPIPGIGALVGGALAAVTPSLDILLGSVLKTLGVGIGEADVWVYGVRCDGAVLVN